MPWQLFAVFAPTLGYLDIMLLCSASGRQQQAMARLGVAEWECVGRRQRWPGPGLGPGTFCCILLCHSASSSNTGPRSAVFDFTTLTTYLPPLLLNS